MGKQPWYEQLCKCPSADSGDEYRVVVVDPCPADYTLIAAKVGKRQRDTTWEFLASGREALRAARTRRVDLWIVNLSLPDISGLDLCRMLRERYAADLFVVADQYRAEDERAARVCGVSVFLCKPVDRHWFDPRVCLGNQN
jgi:DNA-binding response OmpR family regulator